MRPFGGREGVTVISLISLEEAKKKAVGFADDVYYSIGEVSANFLNTGNYQLGKSEDFEALARYLSSTDAAEYRKELDYTFKVSRRINQGPLSAIRMSYPDPNNNQRQLSICFHLIESIKT